MVAHAEEGSCETEHDVNMDERPTSGVARIHTDKSVNGEQLSLPQQVVRDLKEAKASH